MFIQVPLLNSISGMRTWVSFMACLLVASWAHAAEPEMPSTPERPNFIIIMVDDMGYAGLSSYGNPHFKTPEMDRLAAEGLRFTDFHSSAPVCSPTRAGLLTGRYQQRTGVEAIVHPYSQHPVHYSGLQREELTFAEVLQDAGYTTGIIGKWHLGYAEEQPKYHPLNHGFDEFYGYLSGNIDFTNHYGDHFEHDWWHGKNKVVEEGYSTHLINKHSLDFIERHKDGPFCLYIAHEAMHAPFQGPGDPPQRLHDSDGINLNPDIGIIKEMSDALDEGVGQVREKLIQLGLDNNTLVFFFSDNGGQRQTRSNHPKFRGAKALVYEGGHRVPAIAWWPGKVKPGTETDEPGISIDLMPTMLKLARTAVPEGHLLDGVDISPVILEQRSLPARPLYWSAIGNRGNRQEALRRGDWKLVVSHPGAAAGTFENESPELFHLGDDIGEEKNLVDQYPERAAHMLVELREWYREVTRDGTRQPGGWLSRNYLATDPAVFNRKDLRGWDAGVSENWKVEQGAIVATSTSGDLDTQYLWSEVEAGDFYLSIDVLQTPFDGNGGILFRARKEEGSGKVVGYQADLGVSPVEGVLWGKLYHTGGRGMLDMNDLGESFVREERWNHIEILAAGDRIWTALNGRICAAVRVPGADRRGRFAFQLGHGKQTIHYKINGLVHNPDIELAGKFESELNGLLKEVE